MDKDVAEILNKVEELRKELHKYIEEKGSSDPSVIEISKKLDVVLNEYYKAINEKSK